MKLAIVLAALLATTTLRGSPAQDNKDGADKKAAVDAADRKVAADAADKKAAVDSAVSQAFAANGDRVVVRQYLPRFVAIEELRTVARGLYGDQLQLRYDAKEPGTTGFYTVTVPRFLVLERTLLVRDLPETADKILVTLRELDDTAGAARKTADALASQENANQPEQEIASETRQFRPRYVTMKALELALKPFARPVVFAREGRSVRTTQNITAVPDASLLVVCETRERMAELARLVEQIDVPAPQVMMSCMLVSRGVKGDAPVKVPPEVQESLKKLAPSEDFSVESMGLLRCSMRAGDAVELGVEMDRGQRNWTLHCAPQALDEATGRVTFSDCDFRYTVGLKTSEARTQSFHTQLSFKIGEYVVLGTVGGEPIFVVLRAQRDGEGR